MSLNPIGTEWTSNTWWGPTALSNGSLLVMSWGSQKLNGQIVDIDGSSLGSPFSVIPQISQPIEAVRVTPLSGGRFAMAWDIDTDGSGKYRLETEVFKADGTPGTGITQIGSDYASYPEIASLADGGYAVVYSQGGSQAGIKGITFDSHGGLGQSTNIPEGSMPSSVSGLSGGGYVTAVQASVPTSPTTTSSAVEAFITGSSGQTVQVSVKVGGTDPVVAGLANGNFVVAWLEGGQNGNAVLARIYDPQGQPVSQELTLYTNAADTRTEPTLKALPEGGFALAFTNDAMVNGLQVQDIYLGTFSADGAVDTAPAAISSGTTRFEGTPSITVLRDGRYLVRWHDGDNNTAHYQAFDPRTKGVNLTGDSTDDRYEGSRFGDTLDGAGGNDRLVGGDGNDILTGGAGNDILIGGAGDQDMAVFTGKHTDYTVARNPDGSFTVTDNRSSGDGQDTLTGVEVFRFSDAALSSDGSVRSANLRLIGTKRPDKLVGGDGDDTIFGRQGRDILTGGKGKDVFVFDTKPNKRTNLDKITDFNVPDDTIWLENRIFTKLGKKGTELKPAKLAKGFFTIGDHAKDKNDYLIYNKKTGVLSYDADGSGAGNAVELAILKKGLKMTYKDFFVI